MAFERDAPKAARPSTLRWASFHATRSTFKPSKETKMKNQFCSTALFVLSVFPLASMASSPTCANPKGEWVNELESMLEISTVDSASGMIEGTYSSPSGTSGQKFKLIGWSNSAQPKPDKNNVKVISFSVQWGQHGSVTSWSGYCSDVNGIPTIKTIWNLVRSNSDFSWDHVLTNSDTFVPKK